MSPEPIYYYLFAIAAPLVSLVSAWWTLRRSTQFKAEGEVKQLVAAIERGRTTPKEPDLRELPDYIRDLARLSPAAAIVASAHELQVVLNQRSKEQPMEKDVKQLIDSIEQLRSKLVQAPASAVDQSAATQVASLAHTLSKQLGAGALEAVPRQGILPPGPSKKGGGSHMAYRRKKGKDTWHWCRNCSNWPTSEYDEQSSKPTSGELCDECRAKQAAGNCTT